MQLQMFFYVLSLYYGMAEFLHFVFQGKVSYFVADYFTTTTITI